MPGRYVMDALLSVEPLFRMQRWGKGLQRPLWGLLIAASMAALLLLLHAAGALQRAEHISHDQRMVWSRAGTTLHPAVAVVLIDEASLQALDPLVGRYPWPRAVYADLIDFFMLAGARAVVFDVLFTEREGEAGDRRLAGATADSGRVVHSFQLFRDAVTATGRPADLPDDFVRRHAVSAPGLAYSGRNNRFVLPQGELYRAAAAMGVVDVEPDRDGIYRRLRLLHAYDGAVFPALALAPLVEAGPPAGGPRGIDLLGREIATAGGQGVLINQVADLQPYSFAGVYASIQALHRGDLAGLLVSPEEFADKIVFIGASAVGLADIKATPLSPKAPGVTLHASLLSNLLADDLLIPTPSWLTPLLVVALTLMTAALVLGSARLYLQIAAPLLLAALYAGWAVWRFQHNVVYEMAAPLAAILGTAVALWAFIAATEGRDKRRVRAMFSQYVSPAVLNRLLDSSGALLQAEIGQAERLSVLFSDIRGFTSISEQLHPGQVVDLLNTHFSIMSEIIFRHDGTLDKFIGDAIMAFWGAPIRVAQHAEQAVRAAVEMHRGLDEVNRHLHEKGYPPIAIGIGVNTGETILGNIGSARKLDYTVIGDTVNIASRLEGLTKVYGLGIVVSEYTRAELPATLPCALLDLVRVKGKEHPLAIYAPLGLPEDGAETLAQAWAEARLIDEAFGHYRARRWDAALAQYRRLPDHYATLRTLFVSRCEAFMLESPGEAWDGVSVLTSK